VLLAGCVSFSSPSVAWRPDPSAAPPLADSPAGLSSAPPYSTSSQRPAVSSAPPGQTTAPQAAPGPATPAPNTWRTTPRPETPFRAQRPAQTPLIPPNGSGGRPSAPLPHPSFRSDPAFPRLEAPQAAVTPPALTAPAAPPFRPDTPKIVPDGVTVRKRLDMTIDVPRRKQVGSEVTYRVTVQNSGDQPAEEVAVYCEFDRLLKFAQGDDRQIVHRIGDLLPGETREIALPLRAISTGTHCCRFSLRSREGEREEETLWKSVCIDYVERYLDVELIGPRQRTVGSRAEFTLAFVNRGSRPIPQARVIATHDAALIAREATSGANQRDGHLAWDLGDVQPGEGVQLQVEFECRTPARRACLLMEVGGTDVPLEQAETCVEIMPVPGLLDLQVADLTDPVKAGGKVTFEVSVQNIGLQQARAIQVEIEASEALKILGGSVRQNDQQVDVKTTRRNGRLVFDPIDQLAPDVRLVFQIETEALQPGYGELTAHLTSALSTVPVSASEPVKIND